MHRRILPGGGVDNAARPAPQAADDATVVNITDKTGTIVIKATASGYEITEDGTKRTVDASSITVTGTAAKGTSSANLLLYVNGTEAPANITLDGVTIDNSYTFSSYGVSSTYGMSVRGTVNLNLVSESRLYGGENRAGLEKLDDGPLTIDGSGKLTAAGGSVTSGCAAGIGGGGSSAGKNITINGGIIIAKGGNDGAGIGGANRGAGENITINGGTVTATSDHSAAIGGGCYGNGNNIKITNGTVTANGSIGSGDWGGSASNITISGGTVTIGASIVHSVGIGGRDSCSNVNITSGTIKILGSDACIGSSKGNVDGVTISGGDVDLQRYRTGIGSGSSTGTVENISIKDSAAVTIQTRSDVDRDQYPYIGVNSGLELAADVVTGLTTGHLYCYEKNGVYQQSTKPEYAYPVYGITVNGTKVDGHNAKYGILGYISSTRTRQMTYDPATKTLTGNGNLYEDLTITAADNELKCANEDLTGKLVVDLTNTYVVSGVHTMGKLTVTDAAKVTVTGNDAYKVTLDGENITPADQPQPYVYTRDAANPGHVLVMESVPLYGLTVNKGKAYGDAAHSSDREITKGKTVAGATVYLKADDAPTPDGDYVYKFNGWTTTSAGVEFADANSPETSFVMPADPVTVTANYVRAYTVTVDGQPLKDKDTDDILYFAEGETVNIASTLPEETASSTENEVFGGWSTTSEGVSFTDASNPSTSFRMPGHNVVITSTAKYKVTVTGGSISTIDGQAVSKDTGYAKKEVSVILIHDSTADSEAKRFTGWEAKDQNKTSVKFDPNDTNKFTMPASAVTATAQYADLYTVTVDDVPLTNSETNTKYFAKDDTVNIASTLPEETDSSTADEVFGGWSTTSEGVSFVDADKPSTSFRMPGNDVVITSAAKYKVTVTDGKASLTSAPETAIRYAGKGAGITLEYTGDGDFKSWSVKDSEGKDVPTDTDDPNRFTMPESAVTVTAVLKGTPKFSYTEPADLVEGDDLTPDKVAEKVKDGLTAVADDDGNAVNMDKVQLIYCNKDGTELEDSSTAPTTKGDYTFKLKVTDPDYMEGPFSDSSWKFSISEAPVNPDDSADGDGSTMRPEAAIVSGALLGGAAYLVGTDIWLRNIYGFIPTSRIELAKALWNKAGCPAPVSTELYADIDADDTDAQAAARWCVKQGLLKDYRKQNEDGTETVTFKPGRYVARPYALTRWYKLEKLLSEQQTAAASADAPAET